MQNEQSLSREAVARNPQQHVRIAVWNVCRNRGMSQDVAIKIVEGVFKEIAALETPVGKEEVEHDHQ